MSDFTPIQQDAILQPFFALNQNIDLLTFNFLDENAVNKLNWENLDKNRIRDRLKAYQRLLNIGFSPSDAKKRLEDADNNAGNFLSLIEIAPTPEGEVVIPSNSDSEKANADHLHSARAIASMSQAEFVKAFSLDPEKAREIHRNATQTAAGSMVLLANAMQFSSPRVGNMLGDNTAQLRDNFQSFPSYQQLFGSLDYLQCDPCQSISSPAAYFVDLMRIVDQYITQPNQGNQGFSSLSDRRPDLEQIPLTCDNTNDTVPYTQIVNEVLEKKLKNDLGVDVYEHLAQAKYPHTLPFNLYLEQTQLYLNHLNTNLADIYATINPQESDSKTWAQAYLGLTPQEFDLLITAPPPDYLTMEYLSDRYGVDVSANLGGLTQKGTFLKQTGLSCQELNELLYQNLSAQERQDSYIIEVMRNFYISGRNFSGGTYQYINLENDEIKNLSNENNEKTLDCINRFLRLARKLGWSFADLEWVLASTGIKNRRGIDEAAIQEIAKIKLLQSQTKLPLDVLCSFWGYIKTIGIGDNPNRPQDLFDRIFNNPLLLQGRSKYDPSKPNSWNINESASQSSDFGKSRLLAALQLSDEQLIDIAKIFFNDGEIRLDIFSLSKLFRISTILKLLRLKADEFKILLQLLNKNQTNSFPDTFDPNLLIEIIHFCKWLTTSGFTVYELDYILNENIHPSVEVFLTEDKMASFMKNIWKAAKVSEEKNNLSSYFGIDPGLFSILAQQIAQTVENLPNADYHELLLTTVNTDDNNLEWQKILAFLKLFSRMRLLINKLNLTEAELESINNHPEYYNIQSQSFVEINTVKEIENLYNFKKQLVPIFNKAEGGIVKYFELAESKENLEKFTGWKEKQIEGIENDASQLKSVQRLLELKKCFELCTNIGCDIDFFKNMCNLLETESSLDENTAHAVIALVKAKYNDEEWQKVFGKLNGTVEERKCKVLTDFALWKLNKENPRQLSEYLLLDVEMTSCACNSRIQLGILSVQTYLQRCSMGLEAGVTQVDIPPGWWEWITNYRKWEANRKVFLYPENYIDPSLRKSASPIFKELQDELLQSEITTETVEAAYRNYFNKFAELAQLQFVDSCHYPVQTPKSPDPIDTLFIFAKTLTQPHIFYYRRCERPTNNNPFWSYWEKIDLQINSDYVAPIYAFERLFVFWVEIKEITKSQKDTSTPKEKITQATIKYSFLNHSQNWVAPQTLIADVDIFSDSDQNVDKKFWQQVYPIIVPDSNQNSGMIATVFGGLQAISSSNFDREVINFFNTRESKIFGQDKHLISIITSKLLASKSNLLTDNPFLWKYNNSLNLSQARSNLAATTVGNLVIFAGGSTVGEVSDKVDIFEYKDGSLSAVPNPPTLSQARYSLAATTVGNLVIFAGGSTVGEVSDKVDIFEYKDGSLSVIPNPPTLSQARYLSAATTVGNLVIFAGGSTFGEVSDKVDIFYSLNPTFSSLPSSVTSQKGTFITPIKNQPQGFVLQRRSEAFVSLLGITSNLTRLTTSAIQEFNRKLFTEGLDGLLSLESQLISEPDFPLVSNNKLDFNGAYGAYFWEIFFHIPFLIASTLNANQRYNEARQWYQYIFNPTQPHNSSSSESDRFWRFLPFRGHTPDKLQDILSNEAAIQAYQENPFDPHAIARLRIGAYEKAVVMKYIDNLLNWGDALFTQDSWESITQATTLYLLAYDLLGLKPQNLGKPPTPEPKTFAEIKAGAKGKISDFLIDLENRPEYQEFIKKFGTAVPFNALDAYFCVSENQEFAKYWDRVEDRLFKIRHCQNIKGIERQLALFEPPIDPMLLVRQAAAGDGGMSPFPTDNVPNYRFSYLLERAKGMASTVIQLGSTLLNTLEKKDAEELALLRSTQESVLLQLITKTKQKQIEEAQANLDSLQKSLQAASDRSQYYQDLIAGGWNSAEQTSIALMGEALVPQIAATAIRWASIAGYSLPNIYGLADGGMQFGDAINMGAAIADGSAGILSHSASIASAIAQFQRREEEWGFQQKMADWDIQQIETQIQSANLRVDLAQAELDVHNKSIEHSRQVEQFFKDKFTNKELYQWMVGRLSSLYFQTYQIALKMAYSTEKAYQYELNKDDTYLQPTYWDSYKKGLLAGESLMLGLNQLEKAYLDGSDRCLEIEKIISLRQLLGDNIFDNNKKEGSWIFSFTQELFDQDFPGHYCRQIKTISVTIPAVVGPYQTIKATLTQTNNKVLIKPNQDAVNWLKNPSILSPDSSILSPDSSILRQNWHSNQKIAISKGVNDSGLFVLNFQDERYLPFEGTGAISDWTLSMPKATNQIDFDSITDVIITLSYTAMHG